jgi:hypothetical protein
MNALHFEELMIRACWRRGIHFRLDWHFLEALLRNHRGAVSAEGDA